MIWDAKNGIGIKINACNVPSVGSSIKVINVDRYQIYANLMIQKGNVHLAFLAICSMKVSAFYLLQISNPKIQAVKYGIGKSPHVFNAPCVGFWEKITGAKRSMTNVKITTKKGSVQIAIRVIT